MNLTSAIRKFVPTYGYTFPSAAEFLLQAQELKYTPDMGFLEQREWQLIFVFDELKKDHLKNELLGEERQLKYPAYTQKPFHVWDKPGNPLFSPVPTEANGFTVPIVGFPPIAKIKGEIWKIRPQQFPVLDTYKQNTVEFSRKLVRFIVPYRALVFLKDHTLDPFFGPIVGNVGANYTGSSVRHSEEMVAIVRAWMYVAEPKFWDPILTAYDFKGLETFSSKQRRWLDQYYYVRRPNLQK